MDNEDPFDGIECEFIKNFHFPHNVFDDKFDGLDPRTEKERIDASLEALNHLHTCEVCLNRKECPRSAEIEAMTPQQVVLLDEINPELERHSEMCVVCSKLTMDILVNLDDKPSDPIVFEEATQSQLIRKMLLAGTLGEEFVPGEGYGNDMQELVRSMIREKEIKDERDAVIPEPDPGEEWTN